MPAKMMVSSPCASPLCLILFPYVSSIAPACFWLVVEWKLLIGSRLRPQHILVFNFLLLLNSPPRAKRQHPPTCSAPATRPPQHPLWHESHLAFDCCEYHWNGSHLRPRHTAPLYYSMGRVWTPQTSERKAASANPTARAARTLIGEARCQDLGVPLPYQWRERAKLLEGRVAVAAAHVGFVWCCVVCCDSSKFSYHERVQKKYCSVYDLVKQYIPIILIYLLYLTKDLAKKWTPPWWSLLPRL
jgi:hypothetical protein